MSTPVLIAPLLAARLPKYGSFLNIASSNKAKTVLLLCRSKVPVRSAPPSYDDWENVG